MCSVFRIHSVLDELSYTKGKVHKNSMLDINAGQIKEIKFDGYTSCIFQIPT